MSSFEKLQVIIKESKGMADYKGYYYKVSDTLTMMICGMLCNLQTISDIHEWVKSEHVREFLFKEFKIRKIPSRTQFYNPVGRIDPKKINMIFIKWVEEIVKDADSDRTIAIDGKTICSTDKLNKGKGHLHILSAVASENKLILGSLTCKTKINEPDALREMVEILDISEAIIVADALHCSRSSAKKW